MAKLLASSQHTALFQSRPSYAEKSLLFWLWLMSYTLICLTTIWLWEARGVVSSELLELQAQRRLIAEVTPANLPTLLAAKDPLIICLTLLAGSAFNALALLGATAVTLLAHQVRAAGLPRIWTLLLMAQPALFVALMQYPDVVFHTLLIVVAFDALYHYIKRRETFYALTGALMFSLGNLSDRTFWQLLVYLAIVLLVATKRSWREQVSVLLIVLFPSLCIGLTWHMLQLNKRAETQTAFAKMSAQFGSSAFQPVLITAGISIGLLVLAAFYLFKARTNDVHANNWLALLLLLGAPCIDIYLHLTTVGPFLSMVIAIVAFPLYAQPLRRFPFGQAVAGTLLSITLLLGWMIMLPLEGEPHLLFMRALGQSVETPTMPYQRMVMIINERLQPDDRVLLDSETFSSLVPLINNSQALLLPQQRLYALAVQDPYRWARFVVIQDEQRAAYNLSGYVLLIRQDHFEVYERISSQSQETHYRRSNV